MIDIVILLGAFLVLCMIGMPVAYTLGPRRDPRRALDRRPARGGDDPGLERRQQLLAAGDPVLRPRRRDHGRGRHGGAPGQPGAHLRRRGARRPGARQRHRLDLLQRRLRIVGRRHGVDRLGADPADGQAGLPEGLRHQRDDLRLGPGGADPAVAQRGALFARRRRHDLGGVAVPRRRAAGPAVRRLRHGPVRDPLVPARLPERRAGDAAPGREDRRRRDLGPGHRRHHPRRHPERRLHADRIGRGRVPVRVLHHDVRLPRLPLGASCRCSCTASPRWSRW